MAMATVVSGSHMMHLTGKMEHVTVSMQFAYTEEGGQFVMDDCTKQTCRFEIMKPKGSDEQGSFTGQLTLLMPGTYDLNLKSDDESLAFQGIFSSEYGGYSFDGQMVHGTDVDELQMSQTYDDQPAVAATPTKKHHHLHSSADTAEQVPEHGSYVADYVADPITGHFDIAVPVHTDATPPPAPVADVPAPVAVSAGVLPEVSVAASDTPSIVIAQQDGDAAQDSGVMNTSPFSRYEPIIFGISGAVCFVGAAVLLAIGLRRRRAGATLRPNDHAASDHWANPNFTPTNSELVANISVL